MPKGVHVSRSSLRCFGRTHTYKVSQLIMKKNMVRSKELSRELTERLVEQPGVSSEQAVTLAERENTARILPLCGGRLLLRGDALTSDGNPTSRLAGVWGVGQLLFGTEMGSWIKCVRGLDGMLLQHLCWVSFGTSHPGSCPCISISPCVLSRDTSVLSGRIKGCSCSVWVSRSGFSSLAPGESHLSLTLISRS